MKRILLSTASFIALGGVAFAADLPVYTPAPVVEPIIAPVEVAPLWTGAWVGVQAGLVFDEFEFDDDDDLFEGFNGNSRDDDDELNWEIGVAAGADFQAGGFVFGVLGDVMWLPDGIGDEVERTRQQSVQLNQAQLTAARNDIINAKNPLFAENLTDLTQATLFTGFSSNQGNFLIEDIIPQGAGVTIDPEIASADADLLVVLERQAQLAAVVNALNIDANVAAEAGTGTATLDAITLGNILDACDGTETGDLAALCGTTLLEGGQFGPGQINDRFVMSEELDWYSTLRARAGFAFGRALIYGTGGLAFGDVETNASFERRFDASAAGFRFGGNPNVTVNDIVDPITTVTTNPDATTETRTDLVGQLAVAQDLLRQQFTFGQEDAVPQGCERDNGGLVCRANFQDDDEFRVGFALGAGVEFLATDNFSIGAEYLYVNLGEGDDNIRFNLADGDVNMNIEREDFDFHTVKLRAAFRFSTGGMF